MCSLLNNAVLQLRHTVPLGAGIGKCAAIRSAGLKDDLAGRIANRIMPNASRRGRGSCSGVRRDSPFALAYLIGGRAIPC